MERRDQKRTKWLILILLLITIVSVCVTVWALFFRETDTKLTPDYAPQDVEDNAEPIPGDEEQAASDNGGGSVSLSYSDQVTIDLSDKTTELYFANPGRSNQQMVVQIVIQDEIIVQSGALLPGNQVYTLDLLDGAEEIISVGGYEGKFVILYYDQTSGEKAVVNTEIPITITVNE